ncbi:MAG: hypothetical protein RR253_08210, partial [Oscillospiraceae bacterium]
KKQGFGHERALMLKAFMDRKLSSGTINIVSKTFSNLDEKQREKHAQQITSIINSSETEAEILEKLKAL